MHANSDTNCDRIYDNVPLTAAIAFYWIITGNERHKVSSQWVDWAKQLLQAGYSNEQIIELSSTTTLEEQVKLIGLTNVILDKLHIDLNDVGTIVKHYGMYIIQQGLSNNEDIFVILTQLECLFTHTKFYLLYDFHCLFHAYKDLRKEGKQYYWKELNLQNKDIYIKEYFHKWLIQPESQLYIKWEKKSTFRRTIESILYNKHAYLFYSIVIVVLALLFCWIMYTLFSTSFISSIIFSCFLSSIIINAIFYIEKIRNKMKNK